MKLFKNKWFVLLLAIISLGLGVIMLPNVTNYGRNILYIVTAIALLLYAFIYLLKNISKRTKGNVAFWFEAVEIAFVFIIAIGLILVQFKVFQFSGVSLIVAFVVWMRGVSGVIRGKIKTLPLLGFIAFISLGAYFFAKPIVDDGSILIAIAVIFFALTLVFGIKFSEMHRQKNK